MIPAQPSVSVEAWLQWFEQYHSRQCRTFLCTRYGLDALDADTLMNTTRLRMYIYWRHMLHNPLGYFWRTLRREVGTYLAGRQANQRRQEAYVRQWQVNTRIQAGTARQIEEVFDRLSPPQRQLLLWFMQGYADTQVATWRRTTPDAIRQARSATYRRLRQELATPAHPGRKD